MEFLKNKKEENYLRRTVSDANDKQSDVVNM